jgi:predicted signal transduction protein with EAL and GGDEF domain
MSWKVRRGVPGRTVGVLLLSALLTAAGVAAATLPRPAVFADLPLLSWWWLALLFFVAEANDVQVTVRREILSISLAEIPLVMGLFLAGPADVLLGRVVGSVAVFVAVRRQTPLKTAFNAALVIGGTATALAVFHLLGTTGRPVPGGDHPLQGWFLLVAVVAACLAGVLEALCITAVLSWYGEPVSAGDVAREIGTSVLSCGLLAVVGTVAVVALAGGASGLPLAITGVAALLGYRAYAALSLRYARLERLHRLSGRLATATTTAAVTQRVVEETAELLRASYAEMVLTSGDDQGWDRWSLREGGRVVGPEPYRDPLPPRSARWIDRTTRAGREVLDSRGLGEALVVRLKGDERIRGFLLVGDRSGEERGFRAGELPLLQTVADQSAIALRSAGLVDRLHHEARRDELTGLPNRLTFRELLDAAGAKVASGGRAVVMLLDVDGFKAVNDTLGHQAGDELLQELARRLQVAADTDAVVARLGGDEFAVLSSPPESPEISATPAGTSALGTTALGTSALGATALGTSALGASALGASALGASALRSRDGDTSRVVALALSLADRLLACFDEPVSLAGTRVRLGGSLGVAIGPEHATSASDLLRHADIAMYAAKTAGGGARLFSRDMVDTDAAAVTLAGDLRDAIAAGAIALAVLPVVELATGAVGSVEVLARWRHPELGDVPPEVFFAAAERSGQTADLSALVLDGALRLCHEWREQGRRIGIAVNVAPRWLGDPTLPEQVAGALARYDVPADLLCLEITEAGVIAEPAATLQTLGRLRSRGVRLSVDDFGTGYSSLTYLSRLPVHQLKIHHSFVSRLGDSSNDQAVVRLILDLGRHLGLDVVAEGVAGVESRIALLDMGCRYGQGFLFGRPMPPEQLPAYLDRPAGVDRLPPVPTPRRA